MSESISNPLITAQHASGKIRDYQLIVDGLQMVNLPASYVLLRIGLFPEIVLVVAIFISQCCLAARLILLRKMIGLSIRRYLGKVYLNVVAVSVVAALVPMALVAKLDETLPGFIYISLSSIVSCAAAIDGIGCNHEERKFIKTKVFAITSKFLKNDSNQKQG